MSPTTIDVGIPPAWNVAVREIRQAAAKERPLFPTVGAWFYQPGNALTTASLPTLPSIESLGWTPAEALETYLRLRTFADDWDAPGMEVYDDL